MAKLAGLEARARQQSSRQWTSQPTGLLSRGCYLLTMVDRRSKNFGRFRLTRQEIQPHFRLLLRPSFDVPLQAFAMRSLAVGLLLFCAYSTAGYDPHRRAPPPPPPSGGAGPGSSPLCSPHAPLRRCHQAAPVQGPPPLCSPHAPLPTGARIAVIGPHVTALPLPRRPARPWPSPSASARRCRRRSRRAGRRDRKSVV